jgi:hypothetical protein
MSIENVRRGKYIVELKPGFSLYKQITAPQFGAFGAKDLDGANFSLGWSYITRPFLMVDESHHHDFDQFIFVTGGDPNNILDFDAEIEVSLGGQFYIINYPHCIHLPAGTEHGHMRIVRVNKPFMFIDITISPGPSIRPMPKESM